LKSLSQVANQLVGQPMFQIIDQVRQMEAMGRDVVHLEIGEPDFETPLHITRAAINALEAGDTHYVSSWGLPDFIEASRKATFSSRGFLPEVGQVLVTPGANIATYLTIRCLVNAGEEVLYPDPGFPTYEASVRAAGVVGVTYPLNSENGFRITADAIESMMTDKTRLLIINSPSNPTGAVTEANELRKIFDLARRHDIYVFSDEIYARMVFGPGAFFSMGTVDRCEERVIISNGFSKAFAMTGWRLGVVIGPSVVMQKMMLLLQTTLSCVPPFIQRAGIAAVEQSQADVDVMMASYRSRRDLVVNLFAEIPNIDVKSPGGAFYLFPSIHKTGLSSEEFAARLLHEEAVAVVPGNHFGVSGEGFIRISCASSKEQLSEGMSRIRDFSGRL